MERLQAAELPPPTGGPQRKVDAALLGRRHVGGAASSTTQRRPSRQFDLRRGCTADPGGWAATGCRDAGPCRLAPGSRRAAGHGPHGRRRVPGRGPRQMHRWSTGGLEGPPTADMASAPKGDCVPAAAVVPFAAGRSLKSFLGARARSRDEDHQAGRGVRRRGHRSREQVLAGLLGGTAYRDTEWHSIVVDGDWVRACNVPRTTWHRIGRTVPSSNKSTSTCMSTTWRRPIVWRSSSEVVSSKQQGDHSASESTDPVRRW